MPNCCLLALMKSKDASRNATFTYFEICLSLQVVSTYEKEALFIHNQHFLYYTNAPKHHNCGNNRTGKLKFVKKIKNERKHTKLDVDKAISFNFLKIKSCPLVRLSFCFAFFFFRKEKLFFRYSFYFFPYHLFGDHSLSF